jgi:hypothetical protein
MENKILIEDYSPLIDHYYDILNSDRPLKEELDLVVSMLKAKSLSFYNLSKTKNLYWEFCSSRTYRNTYNDRLNKYLDKNEDDGKSQDDFVENEIRLINYILKSEYVNFVDDNVLRKAKEQSEIKLKFLTSLMSPKKMLIKNEKRIEPNLFTSQKAEDLFNRYYNETKDSKSILTEMSFIYRQMYQDGHIIEYVRPEIFKTVISKPPFNILLEHSLKPFNIVNTVTRSNLYKNLKDLIFNHI